MNIWKNF